MDRQLKKNVRMVNLDGRVWKRREEKRTEGKRREGREEKRRRRREETSREERLKLALLSRN